MSSEEVDLLELSGVEAIEEDNDDDPIEQGVDKKEGKEGGKKKGVRSLPSGSGMTFIMDDDDSLEDDDEDIDEDLVTEVITDEAAARKIVAKSVAFRAKKGKSKKGGKHKGKSLISASKDEDDEEADERRQVLTAQYMSGQLSFGDFLHAIEDEEELDEDLDEDPDEDWIPASKKSKKKEVEDDEQDEDVMAKFADDLQETSRQQLGKKRPRVGVQKSRKKRLDPALQGLMGEANLRFARGDTETAIRMCMEVIRQDPGVPEPFQTLSTLYEEIGEYEKSVQFALIGAHLAPQDPEEWARLADMSLELGDRRQAAACFKKAIDADSSCLRYHVARCSLLEELGEKTKALQGYRKLLSCIPEDQGVDYLETARDIARLLHERGEFEAAKSCIESAISKHPGSVQSGDINLMLELLITLNQYEEALEVLGTHCHAQFTSGSKTPEDLSKMDHEDQLKNFDQVQLPKDAPLEIRAKLVVVLLNLKSWHLLKGGANNVGNDILETDPEDFGDLMLDIAEAYMSQKMANEALPFLHLLVQSEAYNKAAVWLRYGECLFETGQVLEAEGAYQKVVELAPQHHEARRTLSTILHQLGRPEEALTTLTQDEEAELLNPALLFQKCNLLLAEGRREEFTSKAKMLFSRHFFNIRNKEEMAVVCTNKRLTKKTKALSAVRAFRREPAGETDGPTFESEGQQVSPHEEYKLYHRLCDILYEDKKYDELQKLTFSALGSPIFNRHPDIVKECEFLCLLSSFLNGDSFHAYNFVRDLVVKDQGNNKLWNLFNLVIMRADDMRHNRFLMRLMSRKRDSLALGILNGHNCLIAGTYKYSLGEYMTAFKQDSSNPMVALMLGLTFIHMACQKFSARKHSLVVQGCAFLQTYKRLRGSCQETHYNLGRAMHQLGILPAALHYYKLALAQRPAIQQEDQLFDLSKETAFNISLIYQASGSHQLARMYINKHIVI